MCACVCVCTGICVISKPSTKDDSRAGVIVVVMLPTQIAVLLQLLLLSSTVATYRGLIGNIG